MMIFQGKIVLRGIKSYTTCNSVIQYFYNITSLHCENITGLYFCIFFSSFHSLIKAKQVMIENKIDWVVAGL